MAGDIVPAAANGRYQFMAPGEANGGHDVGAAGTAHDDRRSPVDHGVPDRPGLRIALVLGDQDLSMNVLPQPVHRFLAQAVHPVAPFRLS